MKKFRQSLWNTSLFRTNFIFTAIGSMLLAPIVFFMTQSVWILLLVISGCYALFPLYFIWHFYVEVHTDKLVIKNGVYAALRREYLFKDIMQVKIVLSRNIYMQVFTKVGEEKARRYCIDVVAPKDYKELVDMIKAKGITVETEGLERLIF